MQSKNRIPLSGEQKNICHALIENPPVVPDLARGGSHNPKMRVFVANFDGTGNNYLFVPPGEEQTLVADSYLQYRNTDSTYIVSEYYPGVGTDEKNHSLENIFQKVSGVGCFSIAKKAHQDLVKQIAKWKQEDPDCEVHVHAVAFSRGGVSALHFLNMVDEHGGHKVNHPPKITDQFSAGYIKSSAVLYDVVSTGQFYLDLGVPATTLACLHLESGGEKRILFPKRSIDNDSENEMSFVKGASMIGFNAGLDGRIKYKRIHQIEMPAFTHSDVGGTNGGAAREMSKFMAEHFQHSLGLPVTPQKPEFKIIQNASFFDSRYVKFKDIKKIQKEKRSSKRSHTEIEKDRFMIQSRIEGFGKRARTINSFRDDVNSDYPIRLEHFVSKKFNAKIVYDPDGAHTRGGEYPELKIESEDNIFRINNGYITFAGRRLIRTPSVEEIIEDLKEKYCNKQSNEPVMMEISLEIKRIGVSCEVERCESSEPINWYKPKDDPWPLQLRNAIIKLNSSTDSITSNPSSIFNSAIYGVYKKMAKNYPDCESIRIYPQQIKRGHIGVPVIGQKFCYEIKLRDGMILTGDSIDPNMKLLNEKAQFNNMMNGLSELSKLLNDLGCKFTQSASQKFDGSGDKMKRVISCFKEPDPSSLEMDRSRSFVAGIITTLVGDTINSSRVNLNKIKIRA